MPSRRRSPGDLLADIALTQFRLSVCIAICAFSQASPACIQSCATAAYWRGPPEELTPSFIDGAAFPTARRLASSLGGMHVAIIGDSTFRLPVQTFESSWLGCTDERALPARLSALERDLCISVLTGNKSFLLLDGPLGPGGLTLTYDLWRHVDDYRTLPWWTRWFAGDADLAWTETTRPPDAVFIGAWLWDAAYPRLAAPTTLDAVLEYYGAQVRAFLSDLVAQPAFKRHWAVEGPGGRRRLFWRAATPTEHLPGALNQSAPPPRSSKFTFMHMEGVRRANAVALRALAEVSVPGLVWLDQGHLFQLDPEQPQQKPAVPGTPPPQQQQPFTLTGDGTHLRPPLQLAAMQHMLLVAAAAAGDADCLCEEELPWTRSLLPSWLHGPVAWGLGAAVVAAVAWAASGARAWWTRRNHPPPAALGDCAGAKAVAASFTRRGGLMAREVARD